MKCEFEEKSFEAAFNTELTRRTNLFFAPGQCAEGWLGFDFSLYLDDPILWELFVYIRRRRRTRRGIGITLQEMEGWLDDAVRRAPDIKHNLFIQYKRSDYLKGPRAKERSSWSKPYYRYKITSHQHKLLKDISKNANGRAAVVYAAPAFYKSKTLYQLQISAKIIESSNIADVGLIGMSHKHFTFDSAGNFGKGHSKPEDVESPSFDNIIEKISSSQPQPFIQHIKELGALINESVSDSIYDKKLWKLAKKAALQSVFYYLGDDQDIAEIENGVIGAIISISAFSRLTGSNISLILNN